MLNSSSILELYNRVVDNDICQYNISEDSIRVGIKSMTEVYKPDTNKTTVSRSTVADFNDVSVRCAYLHKYAALHTAMVRDMMFEALKYNYNFFHELLYSTECFKICSLGGGPGSDVLGVLSTLHTAFSYFPASVTVVDYMVNWCYSFGSIIHELGSGNYGAFGNNISHLLQWRYVSANLLKPNAEVEAEISAASMVTMVKFVSAASCKDTEFMVKNIFTAMKPGAVLFFIDNDGGGFREMIIRAAEKYNFISIFGPFRRENYTNEIVKMRRFGAVSCHKTTVSIHILQKPPVIMPYERVPRIFCNFSTDQSDRRVLLERPFRNETQLPLDNFPFPGTPLPYAKYDFPRCEINNNFLSPIQSTPLTPCIFQLNSNSYPATPMRREPLLSLLDPVTPIRRAPLLSPVNLATPMRAEPLLSPVNLATPVPMNSGDRRVALFSPGTPRPGKRSCFPVVRFKNWRRGISRKLNTIKYHARHALQKKFIKKKGKSNQNPRV